MIMFEIFWMTDSKDLSITSLIGQSGTFFYISYFTFYILLDWQIWTDLHTTYILTLTFDIFDIWHFWHLTLLTFDIVDIWHCWHLTLLTYDTWPYQQLISKRFEMYNSKTLVIWNYECEQYGSKRWNYECEQYGSKRC